jgi:hypothetical protein
MSFLEGNFGHDLLKLRLDIQIVGISSGVELGEYPQGIFLPILGYEPTRRFRKEIHSNMQCKCSLELLAKIISFIMSEKVTYYHLKTHGKPPGCLTLYVTRCELDPESYKNSQIYSTLLTGNDTASDSSERQYNPYLERWAVLLSGGNFALVKRNHHG